MDFCASVHCMDGRIQEPLIKYLKDKYGVKYVDCITGPGPCKILSEQKDKEFIASVMRCLNTSIQYHNTHFIAVSGHYDCLANPASEAAQKEQIKESAKFLQKTYPHKKIIGLWVDGQWQVFPVM
ncbi:MAG: carbonic anhydrase [Candidatus Omnitrophota bacterium]